MVVSADTHLLPGQRVDDPRLADAPYALVAPDPLLGLGPVPARHLQVKALVHALKSIVEVLSEADTVDKADLYEQLGIELTYHPDE